MTLRVAENALTRETPNHEVDRFAISTFGLRFGITIEVPELWDEACRRLPPIWAPVAWEALDRELVLGRHPQPCGERRYIVRVDEDSQTRPRSSSGALHQFENAIQQYIAEFADPWLFVHAGVVVRDGCAIVLPGRSRAGKSTLVHGLVESGATYYSDEYAVLDQNGRVHPYPRRLMLRKGPFGESRRLEVRRPELVEPGGIDVGLVAALIYDPDRGWNVSRLTAPQTVLALCDNTVPIQRRPKDSLEILTALSTGAEGVRGSRGEFGIAVERLFRYLERSRCGSR